ncbi:hypothetical protein BJ741DRAFT_577325 [Chytriomyces cf. hyalinus JEL632]|nr:hypothetical protein BJ741DRAFT_577325 [Chytriomyces cf. hyalinus JEL632]
MASRRFDGESAIAGGRSSSNHEVSLASSCAADARRQSGSLRVGMSVVLWVSWGTNVSVLTVGDGTEGIGTGMGRPAFGGQLGRLCGVGLVTVVQLRGHGALWACDVWEDRKGGKGGSNLRSGFRGLHGGFGDAILWVVAGLKTVGQDQVNNGSIEIKVANQQDYSIADTRRYQRRVLAVGGLNGSLGWAEIHKVFQGLQDWISGATVYDEQGRLVGLLLEDARWVPQWFRIFSVGVKGGHPGGGLSGLYKYMVNGAGTLRGRLAGQAWTSLLGAARQFFLIGKLDALGDLWNVQVSKDVLEDAMELSKKLGDTFVGFVGEVVPGLVEVPDLVFGDSVALVDDFVVLGVEAAQLFVDDEFQVRVDGGQQEQDSMLVVLQVAWECFVSRGVYSLHEAEYPLWGLSMFLKTRVIVWSRNGGVTTGIGMVMDEVVVKRVKELVLQEEALERSNLLVLHVSEVYHW